MKTYEFTEVEIRALLEALDNQWFNRSRIILGRGEKISPYAVKVHKAVQALYEQFKADNSKLTMEKQ
jgi:hypothetical protein